MLSRQKNKTRDQQDWIVCYHCTSECTSGQIMLEIKNMLLQYDMSLRAPMP